MSSCASPACLTLLGQLLATGSITNSAEEGKKDWKESLATGSHAWTDSGVLATT